MNTSVSPFRLMQTLFAAIVAFALMPCLVSAQDEPSRPTPVIHVSEPYMVKVWNRPIVELRASIDGIDPSERAQRIRKRIEELPEKSLTGDVEAAPAQIAGLTGWIITVDDHLVIGLLQQDLDPESKQTLEGVAKQTAERLKQVLRAKAEQQRLPNLLRGLGVSLLSMVLLALVLWGVVRIRRASLNRLKAEAAGGHWELLGVNVKPVLGLVRRGAIKLTAFAAATVAVYLWITFVLVQFPYSRPWGDRLGEYLIDLLARLGSGALQAIPGLFTVLVIFLITRIITRAVGGLIQGVEEGRIEAAWLEPETARPTRRVIVALIWIFAATVAYPYIPGSDTLAFKGVSVLLGVMVSLGSAGLVNQLMSGLAIIYSREFRLGDYVRAGDYEGIVSHIGALSTKLKNRRLEEMTIPNAVLVGMTVTNYSRLANSVVATTSVTIGYDAPWRQVHALLLLAAERTPGVLNDPRPFVVQQSLSDFYVEYQMHMHIARTEDRLFVLSDLHGNIQDAFNEFGVQIMSPHFKMQPESTIIVPKSRWHAPPAAPPERKGG